MEDDFKVPMTAVEFYTGAIEPSDRTRSAKVPHSLPEGVKVIAISARQNLAQMLADGDLDAIFSATKPSSFYSSPNVDYLFRNFKEVEAEYFRRTKIFPIMHVIALKRSVYESNPWIAKTLTKAFAQSLEMAYEPLYERGALRYMLPWLEQHVEETQSLMGEKWWRDGFEENRHVLDAFLTYHHRQGLSSRKFEAHELFAPNALESFVL